MRRTKTIKIDELELTVKELTVRQVWQLFDAGEGAGLRDRAERLLTFSCPELTAERALDFAPSELEAVWSAFEEVNAAFLALARKAGLGGVLEEAFRGALADAQRLIAPSAQPSEPATAG